MIWLKIMGGILVVLSGGGLGFVRADKWRSHRKNLEELRKMTLLLLQPDPICQRYIRGGIGTGGKKIRRTDSADF